MKKAQKCRKNEEERNKIVNGNSVPHNKKIDCVRQADISCLENNPNVTDLQIEDIITTPAQEFTSNEQYASSADNDDIGNHKYAKCQQR